MTYRLYTTRPFSRHPYFLLVGLCRSSRRGGGGGTQQLMLTDLTIFIPAHDIVAHLQDFPRIDFFLSIRPVFSENVGP